MRTSIEVPDDLFRKIRVHTAQNGITFRQFILESAEQALEASHRSSNNAWRSIFGVMADHSNEMERIRKRIDDEFEPIDPEEWK